MSPLNLIRRILPRRWLRAYHRFLALLAGYWYGRPSRHVVVVGITGTDGKTTTAALVAHLLSDPDRTAGLLTTAIIDDGQRRWLNEQHMTMPGRFQLQRMLKAMRQHGCRYAVLEVSSEGLLQHRHRGIDFDGALLTNLSPEHLDAHGSFEAYRNTKGRLFNQIIRGGDKTLGGQAIPKFSVVNLDDPAAEYFLSFWAEQKHGFTLTHHPAPNLDMPVKVWAGEAMTNGPASSRFTVDGHALEVPLPGQYNVANALAAVTVARILGVSWENIAERLRQFPGVPGRYQTLPLPNGAQAVIDYALTPAALEAFYRTLKQNGAKRILAVFGAAGGGRDSWKRPELGRIAAAQADRIWLTTDDPYDEDPAAIAAAIAAGIPKDQLGKAQTVLYRREAIKMAIAMAQPGDVVAITGMGSETSMVIKGKRVAWNDAQAVTELANGAK